MFSGRYSEAEIITALKELEAGRKVWRVSPTPSRRTQFLKKGAGFSGL
jgi:hypothetical protein